MLITIAKLISAVGLIATIVPSFQYYRGAMSLETMKGTMLAGMFVWFVATSLWMGRKDPAAQAR